MTAKTPVFFDAVPDLLSEIFQKWRTQLQGDGVARHMGRIVAIRDLYGRVRFLVEEPRDRATVKLVRQALEDLARRAWEHLGPRSFEPKQALIYRSELGGDLGLPEGRLLVEGKPELRLVERQLTGRAWSLSQEPRGDGVGGAERLAFYSLKGGVGRSTAVGVSAWHLARRGLTVLVLDLDLEAPGLSASLLPPDRLPDHGIVDWFVEDAVGQGDAVLGSMVGSAPFGQELAGEVLVVPSFGADPGDYLAKLGRCYLDLPRAGGLSERWEERLVRLVATLQEREKPDVVLLDVRAGLPDLASAALTGLGASVLLFAQDTDQTWASYRLLFEHLARSGAALALRERLTLVAALVPETGRDDYLRSLRERAWDLFRDFLYDALEPGSGDAGSSGDETDAFTFDLQEQDAPHAPVPIYWNRGFQSLANLQGLDESPVTEAFKPFLDRLDTLVPGRNLP